MGKQIMEGRGEGGIVPTFFLFYFLLAGFLSSRHLLCSYGSNSQGLSCLGLCHMACFHGCDQVHENIHVCVLAGGHERTAITLVTVNLISHFLDVSLLAILTAIKLLTSTAYLVKFKSLHSSLLLTIESMRLCSHVNAHEPAGCLLAHLLPSHGASNVKSCASS